jgi:hypothetical protein
MKFAEQIRAQFEDQEHGGGAGGRNRQKKRRRDDGEGPGNAKAPRLVIKFGKTAASEAAQDPLVLKDPLDLGPAAAMSARNGLDEYDFSDDFGTEQPSALPMVDGMVDALSSVNSSPAPDKQVPKLKIKI